MSDTDAEYVPSIAFDTNPTEDGDRAFVRGYEAGRLATRLGGKPESWAGTYHASNREMLERIAKAHGYVLAIDACDDPTWVFATFTPKPRLRIVSEEDDA